MDTALAMSVHLQSDPLLPYLNEVKQACQETLKIIIEDSSSDRVFRLAPVRIALHMVCASVFLIKVIQITLRVYGLFAE